MEHEIFDVPPDKVGSVVQDSITLDGATQVTVRKQEDGLFTVTFVTG